MVAERKPQMNCGSQPTVAVRRIIVYRVFDNPAKPDYNERCAIDSRIPPGSKRSVVLPR